MVGVANLALQAVPTVLNMVGAQVQKKKDQKFGDWMIQQAEKTPRYAMADTYNKYLAMAKQDPVGDYMREQASRNQATSIGALKSGGAKAILGGLGAVQQQGFASQAEIAGASQKNLQSAMQNYAQQQQSVMNLNVGQREKELEGVFQGELFKKQAKDIARQAMFQGGEDLFKTGMQFAGANNLIGGGGGGAKTSPLESSLDTWLQSNNVMYKSGGSVNKTPGPFSHKTNPIDIVAKGNKIGEMTGGEYILNPSQAAKMQNLASSQKKEALQRYVKTLFNKFNSK